LNSINGEGVMKKFRPIQKVIDEVVEQLNDEPENLKTEVEFEYEENRLTLKEVMEIMEKRKE
jgi:hypothetical protein